MAQYVDQDGNELWTIEEAAQKWGVSPRRVYKWIHGRGRESKGLYRNSEGSAIRRFSNDRRRLPEGSYTIYPVGRKSIYLIRPQPYPEPILAEYKRPLGIHQGERTSEISYEANSESARSYGYPEGAVSAPPFISPYAGDAAMYAPRPERTESSTPKQTRRKGRAVSDVESRAQLSTEEERAGMKEKAPKTAPPKAEAPKPEAPKPPPTPVVRVRKKGEAAKPAPAPTTPEVAVRAAEPAEEPVTEAPIDLGLAETIARRMFEITKEKVAPGQPDSAYVPAVERYVSRNYREFRKSIPSDDEATLELLDTNPYVFFAEGARNSRIADAMRAGEPWVRDARLREAVTDAYDRILRDVEGAAQEPLSGLVTPRFKGF
jgi:hypothetical protein